MPGAHKEGTKAISVWLEERDRELLRELCEIGAIKDRSAFIRDAIQKKAKEEGLTDESRADNV